MGDASAVRSFHSFRLDTVKHCLWQGAERVPITPKAFDVLRYLVEHAGALVTQDELLEKLWPETYVNPELIKKYITEVRKALGDCPEEPVFIKTFPKRGYEFIAPIREEDSDVAAAAIAEHTGMVGRESALAQLTAALEKAGRGQRQVTLVTGEAGIGKTTLVDAFLQQITQRTEVRVARGQCVEGYGGKEAYYPVLEAIGDLLRTDGSSGVAEVLSKQAPTWLAQFPSLIKPEQRDTLQRDIMGGTRERMLREICEALEALSARSYLCLVLEDLHWSDPSSLDLISAIARRRRPAKLLVVGTYRPVDVVLAKSPLKSIKQDLLVHDLCSEIALEPLGEQQVAKYLAAEFGLQEPASLASLVYRHSGGNALFMVAIVQELRKRGFVKAAPEGWKVATEVTKIQLEVPETLQHLLDLQFEQLSTDEQNLLRTASVAGERFPVWALAPLLEREVDQVEEVCEGLAGRNQFIHSAGVQELEPGLTTASYEFRHSLYRQAVYRRLSAVNRSRLHRSLGERLSALQVANRPELASELGLHFEEGAHYEQAVHYQLLSAENAAKRFAHRDSIDIAQHAQQLMPKLEREARAVQEIRAASLIGNAYYGLGQVSDAAKAYEAEAAHAATAGEDEAQVSALSRLAYVVAILDAERGIAASERAVEISRGMSNPRLLRRTEALAAGFRIMLRGWYTADANVCAAAEPLTDGDCEGSAPPQNEMLYAAQVQIFRGQPGEALRKIEVVLSSAAATSLMHYLGSWGAMLALLHLGQFGRVFEAVRKYTAMASRNGNELWPAAFNGIEAGLRTRVLDYEGTRRLCEAVLQSGLQSIARTPKAMALLFLGRAQTGLGNFKDAVRHFMSVQEVTEEKFYLYWYWRMQAQLGLSAAWLGLGEIAKARAAADKFLEAALANEDPNLQSRGWEVKARIAMASDDWTEAEHAIAQALEILRRFDVPMAAWEIHATAWNIYRHLGRAEDEHQQQQKAESAVWAIADSFAPDEPVRKIFLSAAPIRLILGHAGRPGASDSAVARAAYRS